MSASRYSREPFVYDPPTHGAANPGHQGTTPGSLALRADLGGSLMFSSPDTPNMPKPSACTAWDFLPPGWRIEEHPAGCLGHGRGNRPIVCFDYVAGN